MASDADWVEDVRRWYFNGSQNTRRVTASTEVDTSELGYEAAHPALQARNWPEAPVTDFTQLR